MATQHYGAVVIGAGQAGGTRAPVPYGTFHS
jgi:hypothetical protein